MTNSVKRGYLSPFSHHYYLFESQDITFIVKGLRAFWSYKEGVNPSGSPRRFSTLMDAINNKRPQVKGWLVTKLSEETLDSSLNQMKYKFEHPSLGIQIYTSNMNRFVGYLKGYNSSGIAKGNTSFWKTLKGSISSTPDGWICSSNKLN